MRSFFSRNPPSTGSVTGLTAVRARAEEGDADAQFSLGLRYSNGEGDGLDFAEAARWYRKAADQDNALAQYNLGVMFARGQGVAQDDAESAAWIRKAAEGGDAGGQYNLGVLCHRFSVDPLRAERVESRIEAYKWLHLAVAQGYSHSVSAWEQVTMTMTRDEVDEGNRRAAAFVPRPSTNPPLS